MLHGKLVPRAFPFNCMAGTMKMFCIRMNTCCVSSNERAAAKINRWVITDNCNCAKLNERMKVTATGNSVVSVTGMIIKFHLVSCVRGYSSVVEHSTADREVTGSIPVAPFNLIFATLFNLKKNA